MTSGTGTQRNFNGYRSQVMIADLVPHADETTIVGSLEGDSIYVSLRYAIAE